MSDASISELYGECKVALRLYRFAHKAYANVIGDNAPAALRDALSTANVHIYRTIVEDTLREELTVVDAYNLAALVAALEDANPDLYR